MSEGKPNLAIILGGKAPDSSKDVSGGLGSKVLQAIKDDDGEALELAIGAICDKHAEDMEDEGASDTEKE